jgi:4-hydroxy-tetrahydrodipicolinate reductase
MSGLPAALRLGLFGRGRLGTAIADDARALGIPLTWQAGREGAPGTPVDVAIDASVFDAVETHLDWALATGTDLVIGVTGGSVPDLEARVQGRIGVLVASNFSLSVALMARLATVLGRFAALDPARDPYLFEHHHRLKADAPSGTAKTLAAALMAGCPRKTEWTLGPAASHQLSVGVLRAGAEFGTHTVGLDAPAEVLELTHRARSRAPFAEGALAAARWIRGRKGCFTMDDLAREALDPLFDFGGKP